METPEPPREPGTIESPPAAHLTRSLFPGWVRPVLLAIFLGVLTAIDRRNLWIPAAIALLIPIVLIHLGSFVIVAKLFRVEASEFHIFCGRGVSFPVGSVRVSLGWIPTGGYVKFQSGEESGDRGERGTEGGSNLDRLPPPIRILVKLSGLLGLVAATLILLAPAEAVDAFHGVAAGFFRDGLSPLAVGRPAIDAYADLLLGGRVREALGLLAVIVVFLSALPVPPTNVGQAVLDLVAWAGGTPPTVAIVQRLLALVTLPLLPFLAGWAVALTAAVFG